MTFEVNAVAQLSESRFPRSLVGRLIERVVPEFESGQLRLVLPNGESIARRAAMPGPEAVMILRRWRALWRMLRAGEHGFGDAYIDGDWTSPDLGQLLLFASRNEKALSRRAYGDWLTRIRNKLWHRSRDNTRRGSRRNIAAHYDLGNAFYERWLDRGMNYSSGMYRGGETLETAQEAKLARITELLDLKGGERVLEIGCGWGALAERLGREFNAKVKGLTLSTEQLAHCVSRLRGSPFEGRLQDYRDEKGRYDRVVSIEMLEAVGEKFWPVYFAKLRQCLTGTGHAVLQVITISGDRFESYRRNPDFIQRYIFPGGMLPTPAIIADQARQSGLVVEHQEFFGASYARTLAEWRSRFLNAWPAIERLGFDMRFKRMWEYYLTYCEVGFLLGVIDVGIFKLAPR